jgi:putative Mg2+ transporter-C (MgtC) family protein
LTNLKKQEIFMEQTGIEALRFDLQQFGIDLLKLCITFALTLPIAWERESSTRIMGLRTFPLVGIASCSYILVANAIIPADQSEAQARIIQGLMSGIGFIGGGAILKQGSSVRGTATAASVWATGAIGAAVGFSRYEIAILLSLLTYAMLRVLTSAKKHIPEAEEPHQDNVGD